MMNNKTVDTAILDAERRATFATDKARRFEQALRAVIGLYADGTDPASKLAFRMASIAERALKFEDRQADPPSPAALEVDDLLRNLSTPTES